MLEAIVGLMQATAICLMAWATYLAYSSRD
jgi:hypothetical protein